MRVLVTGATGFIGNYLVAELLKLKHEVIATGKEPRNELRNKWLDKVAYIQCDLNQAPPDCYKYFHEPDLLIHLSWEGLPNYKEYHHFESNLFTGYFFIKNLVLHGLRDVASLGTCLEYGMRNGALSEDLQAMPANPYALAKDTLRRFLEELNKKHPFSFKWIRLFYLYGAGQNKNSILEQLKTAIRENAETFNMSGGEQLRDYLPVEKVAEYVAKISLQNNIQGIINCCSGQPVSIRSLVERYLHENKASMKLNLGFYPYPDYEPMAFWGDPAKLKKIINKE